MEALIHAYGNVKAAVKILADRGVTLDRSYVYEIKRGSAGARARHLAPPHSVPVRSSSAAGA